MTVALQAGSVATFNGQMDTNPSPLYQDLVVNVAAGANRAIVCVVTKPGATQGNVVTPTVDGSNMTLVSTSTSVANSSSYIWIFLAPSTGARTVRVAVSVYTAVRCSITAFAVDNVDQASPTGTSVTGSAGSSTSPRSDSVTVPSGGMAIGAHSAYNATASSMTGNAGQTDISPVIRIDSAWDALHTYKVDATTMGMAWGGGATQVCNAIIVLKAAADPPTATVNITADDSVFAGSAQQGASTSASMAITTDDSVFNGSAGTIPGTITTAAFKNNTGTVQASLTGLTVALLRFSDFAFAGVLTGQATNGSGVMTITDQIATPGVEYLLVTRNAAGTAIGCEKYTAV